MLSNSMMMETTLQAFISYAPFLQST